ncbi:MAG: hypothetical protein KGQ66_20630 [Acidobacteriota bacterium]|nr:hypothetical protein [Acidobacteriota bacterium]
MTAPASRIARVVTDVAGMDKDFDYLVPDAVAHAVSVGTEVRVPLHGRRVGGWVVDLPDAPAAGVNLRPLAKVRGHGPEPEIVALASWAAWRWAGKRSSFLKTASPDHAHPVLAPPRRPPRPPVPPPRTPVELPVGPGVHVLRLAPAADPTPLVAAAAQGGPLLVVVPTAARAAVLAGRLRRAGGDVALLPGDWGRARAGGASVVIGARSAAWGPCPGLRAALVLDAHDEALVAEGAPTWCAVTVLAERARRAGVPLLAVTPCPTPELAALGPVVTGDRGAELAGWATVEVVDRRDDDPRLGLWSERLVHLVRSATPDARVAVVLNRSGRVRLLSCGSCGELARCEICGGATTSPEPGLLHCPRCGHDRPSVCPRCGSVRFKALRIGVARAAEELASLVGRPVGEITASSDSATSESGTTDPVATGPVATGPVATGPARRTASMGAAGGGTGGADVVIGTEALLRRLDPTSGLAAVAFVDFDQELLAPRVRATDEALALVALAARLVRGRVGRVVLQTRLPEHPAVRAAAAADPALALAGQDDLRRALRLPPWVAVAQVHGDAAADWVAALEGVEVSGPDRSGRYLVRGSGPDALCAALAGPPRPPGVTLRVAVDPARL